MEKSSVTKEDVIMAILRELLKGNSVLIAVNILGGCDWLIDKESKLINLLSLSECDFIGEDLADWFMEESRFYNASKSCYTFFNGSIIYQVNVDL